ncbi:phosphatase PAP2 family protein [Horticoccus luteus]|uniref:Phosphatase PAP2 family protein n=1 Tax=Horticoccus luteus TaxID=2862869 RepID=A0A8F9TUE3_9BACT|nr:phosphatase PAP2 family protein [Horticoccus luteus]QYM79454.1 phosphatase PAP2 family protein [Horticoccus luteus]
MLEAFRQPGDPGQTIGPSWLLQVARDISALGGATVLILLTLLVLGYLLLNRGRRTALFLAASIASAYLLSTLLKHAFGRPRPSVVPALAEVSSASFPSGHSLLSSAVYLTMAALLARVVVRPRNRLYFMGSALLLSFLIGVSRVFLGVHYPTDVLAGWAAGAGWATLCWLAADWLQQRGALRGRRRDHSEHAC